MLLDCHSHRLSLYPEGILNAGPEDALAPGQLYSMGVHPHNIPAEPDGILKVLEERAAGSPQIAAIGECGLDSVCDTPMWLQLKVFTAQARIAERLGKPMMIHCVRTAGEVCRLRNTLRAGVPWVIHGFRGKPTVLKMLLEAGCHVSYGPRFNPLSLELTPADRLLAETDCSPLPIAEVIGELSRVRGSELREAIESNTAAIFLR